MVINFSRGRAQFDALKFRLCIGFPDFIFIFMAAGGTQQTKRALVKVL